jgi:hypothetical protein
VAQVAIDRRLPGPPVEQLVGSARCVCMGGGEVVRGSPNKHINTQSQTRPLLHDNRNATRRILSKARRHLSDLLPFASVDAAASSLAAAVDSAVGAAAAAAARAQDDGGAVDRVAAGIQGLADGMRRAEAGFESLVNTSLAEGPGPLEEAALGLIRRQATAVADAVNATRRSALAAAPGLDPSVWVPRVEANLDRLLDLVNGQAGPIAAIAPPPLADQVARALPAAVGDASAALLSLAVDTTAAGVTNGSFDSAGGRRRLPPLPLPGAAREVVAAGADVLLARLTQGVQAAQARLTTGPMRQRWLCGRGPGGCW